MSASSKRQSSDVSQPAGSASAKKNKTNSGVSQPAGKIRILFADGGCIEAGLKKCLIKDARAELTAVEMLETAEDFETSIIIGSDFPEDYPPLDSDMTFKCSRSAAAPLVQHCTWWTKWHVWYNHEIWSVTSFRTAPFTEHRECVMIELRHHQGYEVAIMYVKNLKGTAAAVHTLQFGIFERNAAVKAVFSFLTAHRHCPAMVAGDLGVGTPTVHAHIRNHPHLEDVLQTHCIEKETFHSIFHSAKQGYHCTSLHTESLRMLVHQVQINNADSHPADKTQPRNSGDSHPADKTQGVQLTPRRQVYLRVLQGLTNNDGLMESCPDSERVILTVRKLYQPIAPRTIDADGVYHTEPIDIQLSCDTFVGAILLLKKLRADVGVPEDGVTLSKAQFAQAWKELNLIFRNHFMLNEELAADVRAKATDPGSLSRDEKARINHESRGAFHSWLRSLLGDKAFVVALLKHGTFESSDLYRCAETLRGEIKSSGGVAQPAHSKPDPKLRQAARQARAEEKQAEKWARWHSQGWQLSDWQTKQVMRFQSQELTKNKKEANAAYGFGSGAQETMTREQLLVLEVFTNQYLQKYMAQQRC